MPSTLQCPTHVASSQHSEILQASLRTRTIHPRLHYESAEQARKWLALHLKHSPAATQPDTLRIYDDAFDDLSRLNTHPSIPVISLGCGGGNKDFRLLASLWKSGSTPTYIPCDVSLGLVEKASTQAHGLFAGMVCHPVVSDLQHAIKLRTWLDITLFPENPRIYLFLGMLPNLPPVQAYESLRQLLRTGDTLVVSANLAPGPNPTEGLVRVLPQYDNPETRDWLSTLLDELHVPRQAYTLDFEVQPVPSPSGLHRIAAVIRFTQTVDISVLGQSHPFSTGESLLLFFSNRHTPRLVREWMKSLGIVEISEWISANGEEGVFSGRVGS